MSFRQDLSTFADLSRENKRSFKYLLASRWAPGGLEDKVESNDGSAFGGNALAKFRSATEPIEYMQVGKKDKNNLNHEDSSAMLSVPATSRLSHRQYSCYHQYEAHAGPDDRSSH